VAFRSEGFGCKLSGKACDQSVEGLHNNCSVPPASE
jgi:hypothetical protein